MWNMESLAFAFIHKLAKDTLVFPHEMHRVKVPAGYLLCAGTGAGPGEFVDASAKLKRKKKRASDLLGPNPWNDPNNSNFQERNNEEEDRTRSSALCREDVCMYSVQVEGKKPVLAMDVRLAHYKGANGRPKLKARRLTRYRNTFLFTQSPPPSFAPSPIFSHWHLLMMPLRPLH